MVSTRSRASLAAAAAETPAGGRRRSPSSPPPALPEPVQTTPAEGYEKCRDQRIKENLERMKKLGIFDLSLQIKSHLQTPATPTPRKKKPTVVAAAGGILKPQPPPRRSSRLQNVTPVIYAEIATRRGEKLEKISSICIEKGEREEVYTDEHEKLLGTCEMGWALFVDGYGKDGKRIYDQFNGKSCHQCRQKTLGHRTHCSKCNLVQGQFCGDCLFMRYGENLLEVNKNPNWICPVCRGICNCSLCRIKKGWVPTGSLYKKIVSLGYKSVAHYLIQTRRLQPNSADVSSAKPVSSKKSLSFADARVSSNPESHKELDETSSDFNENNKDCCNGENGSHNSNENGVPIVDEESAIKLTSKSREEKEVDAELSPDGVIKLINLRKKEETEAANAISSLDSIAGRLRKRHKP